MIDLAGILVPAATPFEEATGDVDREGFRDNLRRGCGHPVRGFVVGGSTGEAVLLDEDEHQALLEVARAELPTDRLLVAGTGAESTRATLRRCRDAAARGADAVLVQPPAFYRGAMNEARLRAHYEAVAEASPVPVILYQVPLRFSTLALGTGLVAALAAHDNIAGMKDSRGDLDLVDEVLGATPEDFQLLVGTGARLHSSLRRGAVGGILGVANVAPALAAGIVTAVRAGDEPEAERLQARLAPLHDGVVGALGVGGVKAAMDLLGLRGGRPRPPLGPLEAEGRNEVRRLLEAAALLPVAAA